MVQRMKLPQISCEGPGGTSFNGLYGEAPPKRGTFVNGSCICKRVGISRVAVYAVKGRDICLLSIPKGFLLTFYEQAHLMAAAFNFFKRYMGMTRRPPVSVLVDLFRCVSWCTKEAPILCIIG